MGTISLQKRDTPPDKDSQSATVTTDLSVSTALPHHAQEPTDQRMDQPEPHASKTNQLISLTTTPTQPPEDHTPPPVTEPEPKPDLVTTQTHQIMLISPQLTCKWEKRCPSDNQSVPSWLNSKQDTESIRKSKVEKSRVNVV